MIINAAPGVLYNVASRTHSNFMPKNKPGEKPLERYVRILETVAGFPEGISPSNIGEMLDLPKVSVYRLIRGLAEVDMVELTSPPAATCRLGQRLRRLQFSGAEDEWFQVMARPVLAELASESGQACFLARLSGTSVRSIEMVAPDNLVRAYIAPGQEIAFHTGASAKAILAFQSPDFIAAVLNRPLVKFTPETKTDYTQLLRELQQVREDGVASCVGEDVVGFAAIGVPVSIPGQRLQHSLCLTGTIHSIIATDRPRLLRLAKKYAARLSVILQRRFESSNKPGE
jgi:DNA-binding IclR family transcriptional regulator